MEGAQGLRRGSREENMKLQDAMKKAVGMFGADVIGERRLFYILDDFLSFDEYPAMKQAMRVFSRGGYGKKLLSRGWSGERYLLSASEVKKSLAIGALRKDFADYAIDSISYALGFLPSVEELLDHGYNPYEKLAPAVEEKSPAAEKSSSSGSGSSESGESGSSAGWIAAAAAAAAGGLIWFLGRKK